MVANSISLVHLSHQWKDAMLKLEKNIDEIFAQLEGHGGFQPFLYRLYSSV